MEPTARPEEKRDATVAEKEKLLSAAANAFKLNAHAPEFVPKLQPSVPLAPAASGCYYYNPWYQFVGDGLAGGDWFFFPEQDLAAHLAADPQMRRAARHPGNGPDALQRIVKQVEYQFSDANLVASDYMTKLLSKDPEGYVPIAALVSQKKVKSLGSNSFMLAKALRTSSKLVVSEDGKRVRRKQVFSERDKEDLQSRTVIVENLPEEGSRQNLEKIFGTVGRVRSVRICYPQDQNAARHSKSDVLISNKTHALVEYETAELADKAAEKLNDERNWRKGLRVRVMLRRSPRSVMRNKREDYDCFDDASDDDDHQSLPGQLGSPRSLRLPLEQTIGENPGGLWRSWSLGRGKALGGLQSHNGHGILSAAPQAACLIRGELPNKLGARKQGIVDGSRGILSSPQPLNVVQGEAVKQPRGPRMPDGTRGFTMGRGRPLLPVLSCPQLQT